MKPSRCHRRSQIRYRKPVGLWIAGRAPVRVDLGGLVYEQAQGGQELPHVPESVEQRMVPCD